MVENRNSSRVQDCKKDLENYAIVLADKGGVGIKIGCIREPFDDVGHLFIIDKRKLAK